MGRLLGVVAALFLLSFAAEARAQLGLSASLKTDYRYRGRSLSDSRPTLGVNLSYDHPTGFYVGGSLLGVDTQRYGPRVLGYTDYAGYTARSASGPALDFGVTNSNVSYYKFGKRSFHYTEAYAGILTDHVAVRAYYSPSYFGQRVKTLYVDLSAAVRPTDDTRVFGHVGALTPLGGRRFPGSRRERYDLSAGVSQRIKDSELSFSVIHTAPDALNPALRKLEGDTVVLGLTYFF